MNEWTHDPVKRSSGRHAPPPVVLQSAGFITHGDLLRLAQRKKCQGIATEPVLALCRPEKNFWVFKATVYKSARCRGFVGYGDAHPGNVSPLAPLPPADRPGFLDARLRHGCHGHPGFRLRLAGAGSRASPGRPAPARAWDPGARTSRRTRAGGPANPT